MTPRFSLKDYRHHFAYRVRSHECDRQSIMHNARYLEILEIARIEYCRDALNIPMDAGTFATHHKFVFVHNSMDYFTPARFDDLLTISTRVDRLGTTSVSFEQIIERGEERILEARAVMVSLDPHSDTPISLDPELRTRVEEWEGR